MQKAKHISELHFEALQLGLTLTLFLNLHLATVSNRTSFISKERSLRYYIESPYLH